MYKIDRLFTIMASNPYSAIITYEILIVRVFKKKINKKTKKIKIKEITTMQVGIVNPLVKLWYIYMR